MPGGGRRRGTWGSGGGWPGGGGGWPGGGGGPVGFPGGGGPASGPMGDRSHSAGTETIARDSGGDTFQVRDAAALQDTLERLRQRYALYFYLPEGMSGGGRNLQVSLTEMASIRYHGAEIESRRVFMAGGGGASRQSVEPATVTTVSMPAATPQASGASRDSSGTHDAGTDSSRRGRAVNEDSGPKTNSVGDDGAAPDKSGNASGNTTAPTMAAPSTSAVRKGGWPKVNDKPNQQ